MMLPEEDMVEFLIGHGAVVNAKDNTGQTPLHSAAWAGQTAVAIVLLKHGADVNAQDAKGKTPLIYAAEQESEEIILYLLGKNANLTTALANNSDSKITALLLSAAQKFSQK